MTEFLHNVEGVHEVAAAVQRAPLKVVRREIATPTGAARNLVVSSMPAQAQLLEMLAHKG